MGPEGPPVNTDLEEHNSNTDSTANTTTATTRINIGHVVVSYTKGLSESFKNVCGKYGIQAYFRGNTTITQTLRKPKDQDPKDNKSGLIYSYKGQDIACREENIGETARTLGDRCKEHLRGPSPIHVHIQCTRHKATADNFNIIGRTGTTQGQ